MDEPLFGENDGHIGNQKQKANTITITNIKLMKVSTLKKKTHLRRHKPEKASGTGDIAVAQWQNQQHPLLYPWGSVVAAGPHHLNPKL